MLRGKTEGKDRAVKKLALMVAIGRNGAIGRAGGLPWDHPEDRAHFEEQTRGHVVVMGKRTFDEGGPPFGLRSVVVSSSLALPTAPGVFRVATVEEGLALAWSMDEMPFVIGGVGIFQAALPRVTRVLLTEIPEAPEADTFLHLDLTGFTVVDERVSTGGLRFLTLERA